MIQSSYKESSRMATQGTAVMLELPASGRMKKH